MNRRSRFVPMCEKSRSATHCRTCPFSWSLMRASRLRWNQHMKPRFRQCRGDGGKFSSVESKISFGESSLRGFRERRRESSLHLNELLFHGKKRRDDDRIEVRSVAFVDDGLCG